MLHVDYLEFYITNVCNLNCPDCNRFNNFAFKGHYKWDEYYEDYKKWSEILDIGEIGILGGEPLLNPDFPKFLNGIAELWPNATIRIITNGTQFDRWPTLYDDLLKLKGRAWISFSVHNASELSDSIEKAKSFLGDIVRDSEVNRNAAGKAIYDNLKGADWPDCNSYEEFCNLPPWIKDEIQSANVDMISAFNVNSQHSFFVDSNNIKVRITRAWQFSESALSYDAMANTVTLKAGSDVNKAISVCDSRHCHSFVNGKLYKCLMVSVMPEFIKQFKVIRTAEVDTLLDSYHPAEHSWGDESLAVFVNELNSAKPIPQCTLCPESGECNRTIASGTKKIMIVKETKCST